MSYFAILSPAFILRVKKYWTKRENSGKFAENTVFFFRRVSARGLKFFKMHY
jgi:hypothetical protein